MADEERPLSKAEEAGERAARNTVARAAGEILGKLASLVLFAALARTVGEEDLGAYVFAFAWVQIATMPVGLGFDRYILRRIARERPMVHELFFNTVGLKLVRSVPVAAVSFATVSVLGYDSQTRNAVYVLTVGLLLDSLSRTLFAVLNAFERGSLIAWTVVVQRFAAAGLGLAALAAGGGVVAVSATFTVGTALGLAVGLVLMARAIGMPHLGLPRRGRDELREKSRGFAMQDVLGIMLSKLDAVILSFMASAAAVGRYGAAYRLLEATFFITSAVNGAFSAMYSYLERDSEPTVGAAFERSIKFALMALVPCAVVLGVLAEPISRLFFGDELESAAGPLRLLAPAVVLLSVVTLGSSLLMGRRDPVVLIRIGAIAVGANVLLNVALIPPLDEEGAALAMLITGVIFAGWVLVQASRTVGGIRWAVMAASPLLAGAAMAGAMLPLAGSLPLALAAGIPAYFLVLVLVERSVSPGDLAFATAMLRRRLPARAAGRAS